VDGSKGGIFKEAYPHTAKDNKKFRQCGIDHNAKNAVN
jgi:hypothetical protein